MRSLETILYSNGTNTKRRRTPGPTVGLSFEFTENKSRSLVCHTTVGLDISCLRPNKLHYQRQLLNHGQLLHNPDAPFCRKLSPDWLDTPVHDKIAKTSKLPEVEWRE